MTVIDCVGFFGYVLILVLAAARLTHPTGSNFLFTSFTDVSPSLHHVGIPLYYGFIGLLSRFKTTALLLFILRDMMAHRIEESYDVIHATLVHPHSIVSLLHL